MTSLGKIIRYDGVRGYGFIAPVGGGEDVFVHANDFGELRHRVQVGMSVRYESADSDRGPKATMVRIVEGDPLPEPSHPEFLAADDDGLCDVLSAREVETDVTEMLLRHVPSLTGAQIVDVRKQFVSYGRAHGWVES